MLRIHLNDFKTIIMIRPFFIWIYFFLTWCAATHAALDHAHFADSVLTSPTDKPETLTTPLGRVTTTTKKQNAGNRFPQGMHD